MKHDYTLVTTTYNDEKRIKDFILAINKQTVLPKKIVVADGGSNDRTVEILENEINSIVEVEVIPSSRHLTYAQGFNRAISVCDTDFIGIMQTGVEYDDRFFEILLNEIGEYEACYSKFSINLVGANAFQKIYAKEFSQNDKPDFASNAGYLLKRNMFMEVGGFNEELINNGEDADFSWLAQALGYRFKYIDADIKYWYPPKDLKGYKKHIKNYLIGSIQLFGYSDVKADVYDKAKAISLIRFLINNKCLTLYRAVYEKYLIKTLMAYSDSYYYVRRSNYDNIKNIVELCGYNSCAIWGAGNYGVIAKGWCDKMGVVLQGFIDSGKRGIYLGKNIYKFEDYCFENTDFVIVAISDLDARNLVLKKMLEKGFVMNRNIFFMEKFPKKLGI